MWKQSNAANSGIKHLQTKFEIFKDFKRHQQVMKCTPFIKHSLPVGLPFELWKFRKIQIWMRCFDPTNHNKKYKFWNANTNINSGNTNSGEIFWKLFTIPGDFHNFLKKNKTVKQVDFLHSFSFQNLFLNNLGLYLVHF